jgi:cytochrome c peroxidase
MKFIKITFFFSLISILFFQCKKDKEEPFEPTAYTLEKPEGFPDINIPLDNPMTVEGIELGRKLFYDPILSADNTLSCAGCHAQNTAFSDSSQFSIGVDDIAGTRNSPTIINPVWGTSFFWDGRAETLEEQALEPVPNPIEMHLKWSEAVVKLGNHASYPSLFAKAFGTDKITKELTAKAIAQFERTLISANSKYDTRVFTDSEQRGFELYFSEKADCFHCHGTVLLTDNLFHNNGLDETFSDLGLGKRTQNPSDYGKFKTPTLRNIEFSAPYMHDGRFKTLEEVVDFYSDGLKYSESIDPLMKNVFREGVRLSDSEKVDLIAFLKTFSDTEFLTNPKFAKP